MFNLRIIPELELKVLRIEHSQSEKTTLFLKKHKRNCPLMHKSKARLLEKTNDKTIFHYYNLQKH